MSILKEIEVLVQRSLAERGVLQTAILCAVVGPVYTWHRLREMWYRSHPGVSEFDRIFGVDTDGARNDATHMRDLDITSPNWVHSFDYMPVRPDRFRRALSAVSVAHEEYTFIDFGCGKGRAVLIAAEFPFQKVIGIDFSSQLVATARTNWLAYKNPKQQCHQAEFVCADFLDYELPQSPAVLFFFNPCAEHILARVAVNIQKTPTSGHHPVFVLYMNPEFPHVWTNVGFQLVRESHELGYHLYSFGG